MCTYKTYSYIKAEDKGDKAHPFLVLWIKPINENGSLQMWDFKANSRDHWLCEKHYFSPPPQKRNKGYEDFLMHKDLQLNIFIFNKVIKDRKKSWTEYLEH
jgi:hypothetical protein